jgi:hypothetical protein
VSKHPFAILKPRESSFVHERNGYEENSNF